MKRASGLGKGYDDGLPENRERELMRDVAAGSEEAFRELVAAVRPLILSVISRTLRDKGDVEDICQGVLLAIWNGAGGWSPEKGKLSTWVASIARNRSIDQVRKSARTVAMKERLSAELAVQAPADFGSAADEDLLRREARRMTRRALRGLAPEQRRALELSFLEGLTQAEVVERTGWPLGTTKARIRRGMMSLRRSLPRRLAA